MTRSTTDRRIAGIAGGMAAYFDLDSTLVRVAWVIAGVMGGAGILAYLLLWVVIPEGPTLAPAVQIAEERYARGEITTEELDRIRKDLERP